MAKQSTKKTPVKKTAAPKVAAKKPTTKKPIAQKTVAKKTAAPKKSVVKSAPPKRPPIKKVFTPTKPKATGIYSRRFGRIYAGLAFAVLLATTSLWATLGARLQQSNADQLVNSYLFENANTFHNALLPGQHSFLLKWPIFWLIHMLGESGPAFIGVTVAVSLITVLSLAYILYRIDRRPLVIGTLYLALSSVLLLVPAVPYAGALVPVNMAMVATRNIEYIVYIIALLALIRWHNVKSWGFWLAVSCLGLLIASDKLFLSVTLGGAGLAVVAYVFMRRWKFAQLAVKWVIGSVFAAGLAAVIIKAINASHLTHISTQLVGSYGLIDNASTLTKAVVYAGLGILTNFGANPAYDGVIARQIPHLALTRLLSIGGLSFVVNIVIALAGAFMAATMLFASLRRRRNPSFEPTQANTLSLWLIWSSLAAIGAFIASSHDYVVDARYLSIVVFALFITAATYGRQKQWSAKHMVTVGSVIMASIFLGTIFSVQTYHGQAAALKEIDNRNSLVAQALSYHKTDTLVGDYWRVLPTKQASKGALAVTPLSNCTQPRDALSSGAWQPDLQKHSFTYLLSFDRGLTDYPDCSLSQVVDAYGRPNASAVISGNIEAPKEVLLFYDKGAHKSSPTINAPKTTATVVPIPISELPNTSCPSPTTMNVVAHEDDDLLFMNPDVQNDIKAGRCVRTVYVTAGDAGGDEFYWLSREQGSEAAYSKMIGKDELWVQRVVKIAEKQFVTIASPKDNPRVSLVFMRLPDGNMTGQGFSNSHHESLQRLDDNPFGAVQTVTKQSSYTADQLIGALTTLMHTYQPTEIRTQSNVHGNTFHDHSDHMAVGRFTKHAYNRYEREQYEERVQIPLVFYLGYPVHERPANVSEADLAEKEAAFFAYAKYDPAVCQDVMQCTNASTIETYLKRQYQNSY